MVPAMPTYIINLFGCLIGANEESTATFYEHAESCGAQPLAEVKQAPGSRTWVPTSQTVEADSPEEAAKRAVEVYNEAAAAAGLTFDQFAPLHLQQAVMEVAV